MVLRQRQCEVTRFLIMLSPVYTSPMHILPLLSLLPLLLLSLLFRIAIPKLGQFYTQMI